MSNNATSIADYQKSFAAILAGAAANTEVLVGTEEVRGSLTGAAEEVQAALNRQSTFQGQSQQATRDLEDALARGKQSYARLRDGIYLHFGRDSEKLAEFGIQPRRPAVRKKKPGPNPTETTVSETDGTT